MEEQSRNLSGKVIGSIPILSTIPFFRKKFFDILKENTTERDVENTSQHIYYL